jgi:peptidoglycan/xylan/chitin deacetylase (PgdA/CDA1 family)
MYHGVGVVGADPIGLFVDPERFGRQMRMLHLLGLRGVSFSELGDAVAAGRAAGLVGLTFDDGYRDVLRGAVPVLRRYGFTATFFVLSGLLGGANVWDPPPRRELVSADDVRWLAAGGHEIGSHGVSHPRLTEVAPQVLRDEVADSRAAFGRLLGVEPRSFCYPYGWVDQRVVRAVVDAGYSYACAVHRVPGLPDRYATPRVGVGQCDWSVRFAAKLFLRGR